MVPLSGFGLRNREATEKNRRNAYQSSMLNVFVFAASYCHVGLVSHLRRKMFILML